MKWFRDLKIASKFSTVVAVLLALQVSVGIFSVAQLSRVNATSTDIEVNWLPSVRPPAGVTLDLASADGEDASFEPYSGPRAGGT